MNWAPAHGKLHLQEFGRIDLICTETLRGSHLLSPTYRWGTCNLNKLSKIREQKMVRPTGKSSRSGLRDLAWQPGRYLCKMPFIYSASHGSGVDACRDLAVSDSLYHSSLAGIWRTSLHGVLGTVSGEGRKKYMHPIPGAERRGTEGHRIRAPALPSCDPEWANCLLNCLALCLENRNKSGLYPNYFRKQN